MAVKQCLGCLKIDNNYAAHKGVFKLDHTSVFLYGQRKKRYFYHTKFIDKSYTINLSSSLMASLVASDDS